jgi:hypothetical protein
MSHTDKETVIEFFSSDFNHDEVLESLHTPSVMLRRALSEYVESTRPAIETVEEQETPVLAPHRQTGFDDKGDPVLVPIDAENFKFIGNALSALNPASASDMMYMCDEILPALNRVQFNGTDATFSFPEIEPAPEEEEASEVLPAIFKNWDDTDSELQMPIGDLASLGANVQQLGRMYLSAVTALYMTWLANMQHVRSFNISPFPVVWK